MIAIEYENVDILRQEHIVLQDVSLEIDTENMRPYYLIGRVGSGKSSLLKSMYADVPITSGHARVLNFNLRHLRKRDIPMLRRPLGIVFQDFQLLTDRNVYSNLDFVLQATGWKDKDEREERIEHVLGRVGMSNKSYKMPHELSGGEQQRIVIARSLLNDPKVILADEPTGNLDNETGIQIVNQLNDIASTGETAVIIATHNMSLTEQFPGTILRCENKHLVRETE